MEIAEKEYITKNIEDLISVRRRLGKIALTAERNGDKKKANYYKGLINSTNEYIKFHASRLARSC